MGGVKDVCFLLACGQFSSDYILVGVKARVFLLRRCVGGCPECWASMWAGVLSLEWCVGGHIVRCGRVSSRWNAGIVCGRSYTVIRAFISFAPVVLSSF